ncbi:DNA primase small subunit [Apostasia shenzhenica]|uniref:DNA primase n=1 Tax=Apostasia shenzhenica TaxID=1088818 RepID=A0A2H9ZS08_9ASPA|nr:DNA primase small subunit [Apostasia shenzhenica]
MAMKGDLDGPADMQIDGYVQEPLPPNELIQEFNSDYLKVYYGKLFPYSDIFRWMSYGNDGKHPAHDQSYFCRREFSFTLENDVYLRFQSFKTASEMESAIKEKCPHKIDIGPVYSVDPMKRHSYSQAGNNVFTPVERELIFDIDISEYDDVRYCCSGSDICLDCWPLMAVAIKVIDTALRDDFGFNHILWVYSGRRGVHCWVCDSRARRLSNEQRSSIADYFHIYKGGENSFKKASLTGPVLHPFLARSYTDVLVNSFEKNLLLSQKIFSLPERYQKILDMIPDESIASELQEKWQGDRKSSISEDVRWNQMKNLLQSGKNKTTCRCRVFVGLWKRLCLLIPTQELTWRHVSKHMNHLLKAPFCVHPKTGRVCVPIDPNHCDSFDPTSVPTLTKLLEELNAGSMKSEIEDGMWPESSNFHGRDFRLLGYKVTEYCNYSVCYAFNPI